MSGSALITGASGQDGTYLIELLLSKGYVVHAQSRQPQATEIGSTNLVWHIGELTNSSFLERLIAIAEPDEFYNFAAVSRPALSWQIPYETTMLNAVVPQRICEFLAKRRPSCRLFQASSSEIFGPSALVPQTETTPCAPESPYGIAKYFAHRMISVYRDRFDLHASCGILFNHESPLRPLSFVSQKIAHAAAAASLGIKTTAELDERGKPILDNGQLKLGGINVRRDFGFAGDIVEAMHMIVQADAPDDYIIGTGQDRSIAEFCEAAFKFVNLDWREYVKVDEALLRKSDQSFTCADPSKLRHKLGWSPKVSFEDLVSMMVKARLALLTKV